MAEPSAASELETAWKKICRDNFIPEALARQFINELGRTGRQSLAEAGLRPFSKAVCPYCGSAGYFRIRFLGRVRHAGCGSWYVDPARYAGFQLSETLDTGLRTAQTLREHWHARHGHSSARAAAGLGFIAGSLVRLSLGVTLMPVQVIASVAHSRRRRKWRFDTEPRQAEAAATSTAAPTGTAPFRACACGARVTGDERFCPFCGRRLQSQAANERK